MRKIICCIVFVVLFLVPVFCFAEDVHYSSDDFTTFDPNDDIYNFLGTDVPVPTDIPQPDLTDVPERGVSSPVLTDAMSGFTYRCAPFLMYADNNQITYKRLKSPYFVLTPPIESGVLTAFTPTVSSVTDNNYYVDYYDFDLGWWGNGINQTNTNYELGKASLVFIMDFDFSSVAAADRLVDGDVLEFDFSPCVYYQGSNNDFISAPVVSVYCDLTLTSNDGSNSYVTGLTPYSFTLNTDGSGNVHTRYDREISKTVYISAIRLTYILNDINPITDSSRAMPYMYYSQFDSQVFKMSVWNKVDLGSQIGGFFANLWSNLSSVFVPNETMIQAWVSNHINTELDSNNPLNLVNTMFSSIADIFDGANGNLSNPVIDVPALSFSVSGQSVTPFNGYEWRIADNDAGVWSIVRQVTTIIFVSGLFMLFVRWFIRWYDAHYSGGDNS